MEKLNLGVGPGIMGVTLKDGTKFTARCDSSLGNLDNPIPDEDMKAKFEDCCKYSVKPMSEEKVAELFNLLQNLEECDDVTKIIEYLI